MIPALEKASGKTYGDGFGVCMNPGFLREGTAIRDFRNPPLTLVGHNHAADAAGTTALYDALDAPVISTSVRTAEMIKYTSNTWHALKVCFANEIGNLCKSLDVDSHDVMDIFCKDDQLNLSPYYLKPGFALGRSCLPKDVRALRIYDKNVLLSRLVGANNEYIDTRIPHLSSLLCETIDEVLSHAEVIIDGNNAPEFVDALQRTRPDQIIIDLVRMPVDNSSVPADYRGVCW